MSSVSSDQEGRKGKEATHMSDVAKEIASEVKEEAKGIASKIKETTLDAAEVIALALTIGLAGIALGALLFMVAII